MPAYSDTLIRSILRSVKTIAMVGASGNDIRPSYFAMMYLLNKGYRVIPVNPGLAGKEILGQKVYAALKDVPPRTELSDRISKDMRKRGFRFVGSTIVYAHMQATGLVSDHLVTCHRHPENRAAKNPRRT